MVIIICDMVSSCDTNAQGDVVKSALLTHLRTNQCVALDFSGVFNVTSSFLNTAFIEAVEELGLDRFKRLVSIKNANRQVTTMIKSRISDRAQKAVISA